MVLNIKYEDESGRKSALDLLSSVIPLEEHTHIFYVPLVLQLVNDKIKILQGICVKLHYGTIKALFNYLVYS